MENKTTVVTDSDTTSIHVFTTRTVNRVVLQRLSMPEVVGFRISFFLCRRYKLDQALHNVKMANGDNNNVFYLVLF